MCVCVFSIIYTGFRTSIFRLIRSHKTILPAQLPYPEHVMQCAYLDSLLPRRDIVEGIPLTPCEGYRGDQLSDTLHLHLSTPILAEAH